MHVDTFEAKQIITGDQDADDVPRDGIQSPVYSSGRQRSNPTGLDKPFKEGDLFKAANLYQQFDKKGNIFENRLYAKTSLN